MAEVSSIFDLEQFKIYREAWRTRTAELQRRRSYYDGSMYDQLRSALGWLWPRVAPSIRPLYLPLARAVDVDAGLIPGAWSLREDAPQAWRTAIEQIHAWSAWHTRGVLFVHYGAQYGVSGLKVADVRDEKRVLVQPIDPLTFMLSSEPEPLALIVEERTKAGEPFEYAEVISRTSIATFANGQPTAFDGRPAQYENVLGEIPVIEARHIETGAALGEATFQKAMVLLDQLNELATFLATIVIKHAEPQWAIFGAVNGELEKSGDNVWFFPQGSDGRPAVAPIDIAGVLAFIRDIASNVERSLPELAFDEVSRSKQIAAETVALQLMELQIKITRCRPNYDAGYVAALRMAGRAARQMGLSEVAVLDDELLTLDNERAILPTTILPERVKA